MALLGKWLPLFATAGIALSSLAPSAQAADAYSRVRIGASDVVLRGGVAYDRHGDRGPVHVERDHHGRRVYYRVVYRDPYAPYGGAYASPYRNSYGNAYAYGNDRQHEREHRRAEQEHARQRAREYARQHARGHDSLYDGYERGGW